jgi:hypothetical protein
MTGKYYASRRAIGRFTALSGPPVFRADQILGCSVRSLCLELIPYIKRKYISRGTYLRASTDRLRSQRGWSTIWATKGIWATSMIRSRYMYAAPDICLVRGRLRTRFRMHGICSRASPPAFATRASRIRLRQAGTPCSRSRS